MLQLVVRFLVGGVVVTAFALIGDVLKPKTFAGLFGAAPSVALATITLTAHSDGHAYAALEARSMMIGAGAFVVYAGAFAFVMMRYKPSALAASVTLLPVWLALALGMRVLLLR
jgi:hypothetical protein